MSPFFVRPDGGGRIVGCSDNGFRDVFLKYIYIWHGAVVYDISVYQCIPYTRHMNIVISLKQTYSDI